MSGEQGNLHALLQAAVDTLHGTVQQTDAAGTHLRVPLADGRAQTVRISLDDDTLRFSTRCGEALLAKDNPSLYRTLLAKNATLKHGFFALAADGGVELVLTQLLATCDIEEFCTAVANLAGVGDYLEQQLSQGLPGGNLDLY